MTAATGDFKTYCYYNWDVCDQPQAIGINEDLYFSPKPNTSNVAPAASGKPFAVICSWNVDADIWQVNRSMYCTCLTGIWILDMTWVVKLIVPNIFAADHTRQILSWTPR